MVKGALAIALAVWVSSCSGESTEEEAASGNRHSTAGAGGATASGGSSARGSGGAVGGLDGSGGGPTGGSAGKAGASGADAGLGGEGTSGRGNGSSGGTGGDGAVGASGGSSGEAGVGASGGAGGLSGSGSSVGGEGPVSGFDCEGKPCVPGELCIRCLSDPKTFVRCVHRPDLDEGEYRLDTDDCDSIHPQAECDGPEDCADNEYCAYVSSEVGPRCLTDSELPEPLLSTCCFTCDASPQCVLCWNDSDCPETLLCIGPTGAPHGAGGCRVPD